MVIFKDASNWEAYFYHNYFKTQNRLQNDFCSFGISVINSFNTTLHLIRNNVSSRIEQVRAVEEITGLCFSVANNFFNSTMSYFSKMSSELKRIKKESILIDCTVARDIFYEWGNRIDFYFGDYPEMNRAKVESWKQGVINHAALYKLFVDRLTNKRIIDEYVIKIKHYQPDYIPPKTIK